MKNIISNILILLFPLSLSAQTGSITGFVKKDGHALEFVTIKLKDQTLGAITNHQGKYTISEIPYGNYTVLATFIGFEKQEKTISINAQSPTAEIDFDLKESNLTLEQVVVTGTRTYKRQTQSPVIVNIIDSKTLENVQACNLSEGLKFQPGLRVETDCQTCNYTQLRMNGLAGGYSQILINGRPIFSPLTGLYGMEQIPANMIDRIEVVRGGGSALYGSSAIGGTVNVITKLPKESSYDVNFTHQNINGKATDNILSGNATVLTHKGNAGASFFVNKREREYYDDNDDNFSELPKLKNNSFGSNFFFLPADNQKLEISLSSLYEYRYGGEMVDKPAHLAAQSEERAHNVLIGSADYQINFNNNNSSFIGYVSGQKTDRTHYTGVIPDDSAGLRTHLANPPYGTSLVTTYQGGGQINHRFKKFLMGENVITGGAEYVEDKVLDEIKPYNYKIDQITQNLGIFLQSDWEITPSLNLLTGIRADKHNLLDNFIFSPRASILYKLKKTTQFRFTWGTGFRAPQAFDTDLHIAFSGGGISRIQLSPNLKEERSNSLSASINYDKATENYIVGFTLEGFHTRLNDAFYQHPLGEDAFGEVFEKRNGKGAVVQGTTLELRGNYNKKVQLETGVTIQSSQFEEAVKYSDVLPAKRKFLRTPDLYGFSTLTFTPNKKINASMNLVYTGEMDLVHMAGAPGQAEDEFVTSEAFTEMSFKVGYTFGLKRLDSGLELFGGVKNIFNAYQKKFDKGKNRDSNFVYGPAAPRTIFIGLRLRSF